MRTLSIGIDAVGGIMLWLIIVLIGLPLLYLVNAFYGFRLFPAMREEGVEPPPWFW